MWIDEEKKKQNLRVDFPLIPESLSEDQKNEILNVPNITSEQIVKLNTLFAPYIFYKTQGHDNYGYTKYKCFCTFCNREFETTEEHCDVKHNQGVWCPLCDTYAIAKSAGYSQKNLSSQIRAKIYSQRNDTVYILALSVYKNYNGDGIKEHDAYYDNKRFERMPDLLAYVEKLYILRQGNARVYRTEYNYQYAKPQYREQSRTITKAYNNATLCCYPIEIATYDINMDNVVKNSFLKYSAVDKVDTTANELKDIAEAYLTAYAQYPILEMVVKMGQWRLVHDLIFRNKKNASLVNWRAKKPKEFFKKLSMKEVQDANLHNVDLATLKVYQDYKKAGIKKDWEYCKLKATVTKCQRLVLIEMEKESGITFDSLYKYLAKQKRTNPEVKDDWSMEDLYRHYLDYYRMGKNAGYDFNLKNNSMPRDLMQAHDLARENLEFMRQEKIREKERKECDENNSIYKDRYKKLCRKYKRFDFPGVKIVVPPNAESIIAEGQALEHCVGGYAARHCKGITTILFVRKPNDVNIPWFTIEVSNDNQIVQCHGYKNECTEYKDGKFIKHEKPKIIKAFEKSFADFLNAKCKRAKKTG